MGQTFQLTATTEFAYDSTRSLFYVATRDGGVYALDPTRGTLEQKASIPGALLSGLDVSPDGTFMLVADQQTASGSPQTTLHRISLPNWSVGDLSYRLNDFSFGSFDVSISKNNVGVVTGAGSSSVLGIVSSGSGGVSVSPWVGGYLIATRTYLISSEDNNYALILQPGSSPGGIALFSVQTGTYLNHVPAAGEEGGFNTGAGAISEAAGLIVKGAYNHAYLYDLSLNYKGDLASKFGSYYDSFQFNAAGHQLFVASYYGDIKVYDVLTWKQVATVPTSAGFDGRINQNAGMVNYGAAQSAMEVSDDGRYLLIRANGGLEIIDLARDLKINLAGGATDDLLHGAVGSDTLSGGAGADTLAGGGGGDLLDGGTGIDLVSYGMATSSVTVYLTGTAGGADTITGVEHIIGSNFGDYLVGSGGADILESGDGADTVFAGQGDDLVLGGGGRSYLRGEEGADSILGGREFDDINGNQGADTVRGGDGDDWVVGGQGSDMIHGDAGGDIVYGNLGDDTQFGGDGFDWVRGGQGNDSLDAGAGDDWIWGDRGDDTVAGGAGADVFHIFTGGGLDRVTDFSYAQGDRVVVDYGAYSVSQVGADTVVDLGSGDRMVLVGVTASSLPAGWISAL
ncbi:calcium-binding protein [Phenylobacterium sp.]|uniref:calcium-binding protein n=1 Tax=Phenylobacterium sp. TaxID=1871053 RepID=UPI002737856A|nr:calcium-binding protein [Phenylobacterium sp.]MDP3867059.1 calcium-binding protein [Phenylobacterium sp.]